MKCGLGAASAIVQADYLGNAGRALTALDLDHNVIRNPLGGTSSASAILTRPRSLDPTGTGER